MRSVVQFDQLPLQSMANELFGVLAVVMKPLFQGFGDQGVDSHSIVAPLAACLSEHGRLSHGHCLRSLSLQ